MSEDYKPPEFKKWSTCQACGERVAVWFSYRSNRTYLCVDDVDKSRFHQCNKSKSNAAQSIKQDSDNASISHHETSPDERSKPNSQFLYPLNVFEECKRTPCAWWVNEHKKCAVLFLSKK